MKTPWLIGIVLAIHVVVVGGFMLIQGCGTTRPPWTETTEVKPVPVEPTPVALIPVEPVVRPVPIEPISPPETVAYVVEKGDALSLIAKRFGVSVAEIAAMNGMKDPNKIRAGQKIKLPGYVNLSAPRPKRKSAPKKAAAPPAVAAPVAWAAGDVYVVQKGDVLSRIAKRHGTTSAALRKANNLSGDLIQIGQKLALPGAEPTVEAPPAAAAVTGEPDTAAEAAPEVFQVAGMEPAAPTAPSESAVAPTPSVGGGAGLQKHVVDVHEDLTTIAYMYNVDMNALKEINGLSDGPLKLGQVLKIPIPMAE